MGDIDKIMSSYFLSKAILTAKIIFKKKTIDCKHKSAASNFEL